MPSLFEPLPLGALTLPNRVVMAPLTRARAGRSHIANALMGEHCAQRASAGMLIAEATMVAADGCAFTGEPGIHDAACVAGWRVVDLLHQAARRALRPPRRPAPVAAGRLLRPEGERPRGAAGLCRTATQPARHRLPRTASKSANG